MSSNTAIISCTTRYKMVLYVGMKYFIDWQHESKKNNTIVIEEFNTNFQMKFSFDKTLFFLVRGRTPRQLPTLSND